MFLQIHFVFLEYISYQILEKVCTNPLDIFHTSLQHT